MRRENTASVVRDYLANERTFLAWIRGSVAIMGVGVVVAKLGIILGYVRGHNQPRPNAFVTHAAPLGTGLVAAGLVIIAGATAHYLRVRSQIERRETRLSARTDIILTAGFAAFALVLAAYLFATA